MSDRSPPGSPVSDKSPPGSPVSDSSFSVTGDSWESDDDDTLPLLEIFKMTYVGNLNKFRVMPKEQAGFIRICSDRGVQYVYKVDASDRLIEHGDELDVTVKGPTICYSKNIYLEYDLFSGDFKGRKCLGWEPDVDDALSTQVQLESSDCSREIAIIMGCFANATVATVEVTLSGISAATKVYGVVAANNSILDTPNCTSLLFVKKPDNVIEAGDKGVIPLSKSRVGVPLKSVLYLDISLNVNDYNHTASLQFNAQKEGESTKDADDMIKVKVSWCADEDKMCLMYDEVHTADD
ncbi:hypothetical protein POM88_022369 [Heracleum sosnowskyi]|uniref:DUF6598 domain-containing protein n=1 Tax=Heracleum sosnowskyi TaxID=360622 RepID=A0AAD8MTL2_9APIA|nr:hypothetical protein POM88_022369 [Heracleum sosnowskyi]